VREAYPQIETLVLHFPDAYGMTEEGSDPWPRYVDRLVEEIDREPSRRGRPLLLFGHSRGNAPAMTVAARLKERVLKVYIASSNAPIPGEPSPFKALSERFKASGDTGLLEWFVSLQPGNLMLEGMLQSVRSGEMRIEDSAFLNAKIGLMRRQYMDAMWPDMDRDFAGVTAPILAFLPRSDATCSVEGMELWKQWTAAPESSRLKRISGAGHMDCLKKALIDGVEGCVLIEAILQDIGAVIKQQG